MTIEEPPGGFKPNDEIRVTVTGRFIEGNLRGVVLEYDRAGKPGKIIPTRVHVMDGTSTVIAPAPAVTPAVRQARMDAYEAMADATPHESARRAIRRTLPYVGSVVRPDLSVVGNMATLTDDAPEERHRMVCLVGAPWFADAFAAVNWSQTRAGHIVTVASVDLFDDTPEDVELLRPGLERLSRAKIDLADEVVVINPGGMLDAATERAITYATRQNKPLSYLCPPHPKEDDHE